MTGCPPTTGSPRPFSPLRVLRCGLCEAIAALREIPATDRDHKERAPGGARSNPRAPALYLIQPRPMARYPQRYTEARNEYAEKHIREALELQAKYQLLYDSVRETFFGLPDSARDALLEEYGKKYGGQARAYAVKTIPDWKTGRRRLSGQTMTRLLELVPRHVSAEKKYEFVKQTRARTLELLKPSFVQIDLQGADTFGEVLGHCLRAIAGQDQITFPEEFYEIRSWITAKDAKMMEQLIVDIEKEAHQERIIKTLLTIPYILALKRALPAGMKLTVTVRVPTLTYVVSYVKTKQEAKRMESDADFLTAIERADSDLKLQKGEITLHEHLLRNWDQYLTPEQQNELRKIALEEGLKLDALRTQMMTQSKAASYDLQQFQEILEKLRTSKSKATATGTFQTASGEIRIESRSKGWFGCGSVLLLAASLAVVACLIAWGA